ncbi:MAG: DNA replication/repair protein RecF, partial [Cellulomonadaceae bacterium]|nr:DNA replication/repair protein RecF [Cellulomonadaceae bacterium]
MHVSSLSLTDFRSYEQVDLDLEPGVSALVGPNGQGKTNLVEAIGYVATLSSHRVSTDAALVRAGAPRAVVRVRAVRGERQRLVELEINPGRANRAQINRAPARRARDVLGILRTVLFAPEDLALVKGDPDGRRRFLDELAVQVSPRMAGVFADHDRVLRQRGALLKTAGGARRGGQGPDLRTLDVWDARLAQIGAQVLAMRVALVEQLRPHVAAAYAQVSEGQGEAVLGYRSSLVTSAQQDDEDPSPVTVPHLGQTPELLEAQLLEAMSRMRSKEIDRGVSLVGP